MNKEIIKSIEELSQEELSQYGMEGFKITTNNQEIFAGISSGQSCCEDYGYLISHDDFEDFKGAELLNICLTDTLLKSKSFSSSDIPNLDYGGTIFCNFETSKGTLQFIAYNAHNGYYGHTVMIKSNQLNFKDSI